MLDRGRGWYWVWVRGRQRIGKEPRDGPWVRGDHGQHRFLQAFVKRRGFVPQPQQQLPCRVGIVQGAVWPRLRETKLGGQERQAVAWSARQHDPGDLERVKDLPGRVPYPRRQQEVDVE